MADASPYLGGEFFCPILLEGLCVPKFEVARFTSNEPDEGRYGPFGCNLFVFHLPGEWGDDDLYESFAYFGNIVDLTPIQYQGETLFPSISVSPGLR